MWDLVIIGLGLGFFGSLHCVGMCGSLMLYHFSNLKKIEFPFKFFIYHIFRLLAYALLGMMFGQIGFIGSLIGLQKIISVISGLILIYMALTYFFPIAFKKFPEINIHAFISSLFNYSSSSLYRFALSGFANGLLPCGFLFIAITFSISTYSMINGIVFMLFFGLGTIPALLIFSLISNQSPIHHFSKFIMPSLTLIVGILLILRTMNLGIPFISPNYHISGKTVTLECHK